MADLNRIDRYKELKKIIKDNVPGVNASFAAMMEIKESKLYLLDYPTFEDFAYKEFGYKRTKAWRIASSFKALDTKPARPESGRKVPNLTSDQGVSETNDTEFGMGDEPAETPTEKAETPPEILIYHDQVRSEKYPKGQQLEGEMAQLFMDADEQADAWLDLISQLKLRVVRETKDDKIWSALNISEWNKGVKYLRELIKFARPWALCNCGGDGGVRGGCKTCKERVDVSGMSVNEVKAAQKGLKGRGWLIESQYRVIPEDEK